MTQPPLTRRQRINIWWRYIGSPRAYGIALTAVHLTLVSLATLIVVTVLR